MFVAPFRLLAAVPMVSFPYRVVPLVPLPIAAVVNEAIHFTTGFAAMLNIFN